MKNAKEFWLIYRLSETAIKENMNGDDAILNNEIELIEAFESYEDAVLTLATEYNPELHGIIKVWG